MLLKSALNIKTITTRNRVFLAPMAGITDLPFRQIAFEYGAGLVFSEMTASQQFCYQNFKSKLRAEGQGLYPHIVQLAGRDPYWMAEAAQLAEQSGANMIDINMGCPAKKVVGAACGAALMRDKDLAFLLIKNILKVVTVPVSIKMRLGWDESEVTALPIAREAENLGISLITIHARTRNQFYKGKAQWKKVKPICESVTIPVVINGDILDQKTANEALKDSQAQAIMIGRAAYGQPWLLGEIVNGSEKISLKEKTQIIFRHYDMLLNYYGNERGIKIARKHVLWYIEKHELGVEKKNINFCKKEFAKKLMQETNLEKVKDMLHFFFD